MQEPARTMLRGVTPLLYAFVATELLGAALQLWALGRLREPLR